MDSGLNPVLELPKVEYAGIWRRFFAPIIDELFQLVVILAMVYLPSFFLSPEYVPSPGLCKAWIITTVLVLTALDLCFRLTCVVKYGGTPGDLVLGLRVRNDVAIDSPNYRIAYRQAFMRCLVSLILSFITMAASLWVSLRSDVFFEVVDTGVTSSDRFFVVFKNFFELDIPVFSTVMTSLSLIWLLVELIAILSDEKKRAVSDFMGSTVVVKTNQGSVKEIFI